MHYEPKCTLMKHRCSKICISQNCNINNPFCCDTCGNHHANTCEVIEYKEFVKRMHKSQGINRTELLKYQQYVQQTFKTLIKSLQAEFINFREQFQHINASNRITEFFQLLKSHKENKLTARIVFNILNEKQVLKNKYHLKSQAAMWSLSTELVQLQKKVNTKLKYYYALYEFDSQNEEIKQVSLDLEEQHQMKQIQMKYRQYRNHLNGSLLEKRITSIETLFSKQIYNAQILYKASENDFSAAAFHKACDGKSKTLTIAKTQFGNIVGGYTSLPWRSPSNWEYSEDTTNETFIFSLSKSLLGLKFQPYKLKFTIGMHRDYGPCFGDDLVIYDKSNTSKNCWSNFPDCYRCKQKEVEHSERTIKQFVGVSDHFKKFNIVDWQVYKISFDSGEQLERSFMEEYRKI